MQGTGVNQFVSDVQRQGDRSVVVVRGELDLYTSPRVKQQLHDEMDAGARDVVVDLSGVDFIDSTALGLLIGVLRRLSEEKGRLTVVATTKPVLRVFAITGLDKAFTIVREVPPLQVPPLP